MSGLSGCTDCSSASPLENLSGLSSISSSAAGQAGYPFADRVPGSRPLWGLETEPFEARATEDAARLERAIARMEVGLAFARRNRELINTETVESLSEGEREKLRQVWVSILDPLLALDRIKRRYQDWYGVDYLHHPDLHSMAYALSFAALCAQVEAGQRFLSLIEGRSRAQTLFDEAMPELGLPSGTFSAVRAKLARVREQSLVPVGRGWFDLWIARHLRRGELRRRIRELARGQGRRAARRIGGGMAVTDLRNKTELLRSVAFARWLPVQREVAEWFGDTRVVPADRRLISDAQIEAFGERLDPGDVIVERRNWYLSNVGLPGFWPHAALYVGSQAEIREAFDSDPEVSARFGTFSEHLAEAHPEAWAAFGEMDHEGHPHVVLEAVSEGVVAASLPHSCGADYVAAMRPRVSLLRRAVAIDRALRYFGRPYDFNFDFATDDQVVCSELVMKAYEGEGEDEAALTVPPITVAGQVTIPPTEIVRTFARELGSETRQLDFVAFLDGREGEHRAIEADAAALAASAERPKWDIVQP